MHSATNTPKTIKYQELINAIFAKYATQYLSVTVAGIIAKTSVASYLTNILIAAGYTVGNFTPTTINHSHEQITINNIPINSDEFFQIKNSILAVSHGNKHIHPVLLTALIAHYYFNSKCVDIALFEISGSTLEYFTEKLKPYLKIITTPTTSALSRHTAENTQHLVTGAAKLSNFLLPQFQALANKTLIFKHHYALIVHPLALDVVTPTHKFYSLPLPNIRTMSQMENIAMAMAAIAVIMNHYPVNNGDIKQGILNTNLHGRFQLINGPAAIVIDVAHNKQALTAMVKNMVKLPYAANNIAVFSWEKSTNLDTCIKMCNKLFSRWYIAKADKLSTLAINKMIAVMAKNNIETKSIYPYLTIHEAFTAANNYVAQFEPKARIVCFGSNMVIKEVLPIFTNMRK
ncbi:MAG: hypothetical protein RL017_154 [Pseudomonadota bacterium]|jgi:dihydrofolate synthase/folylpolyglutamate synthase